MNNNRVFFLMLLGLIGLLMWQAWLTDYHTPKPASGAASAVNTATNALTSSEVPSASSAAANPEVPSASTAPIAATTPAAALPMASAARLIKITTDVLELTLDTRGGTVVQADLLKYAVKAGQPERVRLMSADPVNFYVAQSGFAPIENQAAGPSHLDVFNTDQTAYRLADGQGELRVPLVWQNANGLKVEKTFILKRGEYVMDVQTRVQNTSSSNWIGQSYRQLIRTAPPPPKGGWFATMSNPEAFSFVGAAWFSPDEKYEKRRLDEDYVEEPLKRGFNSGWIAMLQHYFFSAWLPTASEVASYESLTMDNPQGQRFALRSTGPMTAVPAGGSADFNTRFYVGPKLQKQLPKIAPGLELTSDYGWATVFAKPLFWLLDKLHGLVKNWGIAIILLTLLVKIAFYKLSEAQYRSAAKMRKLQPRIQALKERYGDDRQKMSQAMLELQQKEKINPLGGCLPILIQFPVFIALYWVLLESVELRHAPFLGWIQNISLPDPFFILPVLNVFIMWLTQKLTPMVGMDPVQQKMFAAMPFVFGVMFAFFPAGLVLYWVVNGGLGVLQQQIITKRIEADDKKAKA